MSDAIELRIPGREVSLGGVNVKRVLPFAKRRMVGPFIFLDHMGPHVFANGFGLDIGPHPHIGLSTLTYLLEGQIRHRDGLGSDVEIHPGAVNWMTAGSGLAHSERLVEGAGAAKDQTLHGLQIWVALPDASEDIAPSFHHIPAEALPRVKLGECECVVVAGTVHGKTSPVPVHSPLFLLDVAPARDAEFRFDPDGFETAVYVARGEITLGAERAGAAEMLVLKSGAGAEFRVAGGSRVLVLGGQALPQTKHIWWNFVSSSKDKIEDAKRRWENDEFAPVVNESRFSRIPLPRS